jgi:CHAD domain-containing protein
MPHRIGKREDIGSGLARLIADDLAAARRALVADGPAEARIHRARQRLKRVRSVLRVLRPEVGTRATRSIGRLRDAARLLAGARDADAAAASARSIKAAQAQAGDNAGFDRVVAYLDYEARETHARAVSTDEAIKLLAAAERDLARLPADIDGRALLERAIDKTFRRGRTARRRAEFSLATPDLHRWRKLVKELWHLLRLARKRLPKRAGGLAVRLERLSELLGLDHDHAVLAERLALSPGGDPALLQQLSLIAKERRALEAEAFALGARIYSDKPKKFRRRMPLK